MSKKILEEDLSTALRYIVDNFGKNALLESNRVNAILSDLVPKLSKENKWVKEAIELGITKELLDDKNYDTSNRKLSLNKAKSMMEEEHIAPERIDFVLNSLLYGLGWTNEKINEDIDELKIKYDSLNIKEIKNDSKYEDEIETNKKINNENMYNETNQNSNNYDDNYYPTDESISDKFNKNKKKFIIPALIVLIIGIIGSLIFKNISKNEVYAKEITFDQQYEKQGDEYIFKKGDFILMGVSLGGKNPDDSKLSYTVDDKTICTVSNEFNKCRITGVKQGSTIVHIKYDNKEIKCINLEFSGESANDISVKDVSFSQDYTVKNGIYTFPINTPIDVGVTLESNSKQEVDSSKLGFEVGDSNICELEDVKNGCTILGTKEGNTFLRIMYNNKKIKVIPISFESESSNTENQNTDNIQNNDGGSYTSSESDGLESNDAVDLTVKGYLENYPTAMAYGDVYYVGDYLTPNGALYKELEKSLPDRYDKGVTAEVLSYKKNSMKKEGYTYRAGYTIEYLVHRPEEGDVYQTEYMEFIVVKSGSTWLIDRYENWKLLQQSKY